MQKRKNLRPAGFNSPPAPKKQCGFSWRSLLGTLARFPSRNLTANAGQTPSADGNLADRYNMNVARLAFFVGKGGVGKTTVSAAYAVHTALSVKQSVLILSTDPAHSLADVLQVRLGDRPSRVQ